MTYEGNANNNITGIKQEQLNGKDQALVSRDNIEKLNGRTKKALKVRTNVKRSKKEGVDGRKQRKVLVERIPEVHSDFNSFILHFQPMSPLRHRASRDEMLLLKKMQLRRRIEQFKGIRRFRTTERSKLRFRETLKVLKRLDCLNDHL